MRFLVAIAGMVLLAGCSLATPYAMVDGTFLSTLDKTMEDTVVSLVSGKDCSTVRADTGLSYCVEDEPNPSPAVYCYRTLANVTCYDRPDPHNGRHQRLGDNRHNVDQRR